MDIMNRRKQVSKLDLSVQLPIKRIEFEVNQDGIYYVSALEPMEDAILKYDKVSDYINNINRALISSARTTITGQMDTYARANNSVLEKSE